MLIEKSRSMVGKIIRGFSAILNNAMEIITKNLIFEDLAENYYQEYRGELKRESKLGSAVLYSISSSCQTNERLSNQQAKHVVLCPKL